MLFIFNFATQNKIFSIEVMQNTELEKHIRPINISIDFLSEEQSHFRTFIAKLAVPFSALILFYYSLLAQPNWVCRDQICPIFLRKSAHAGEQSSNFS